MKTGLSPWSCGAVDVSALVVRWSLGTLFLYMGLTKALHPVEFLKLVRQYEMTQNPLFLNSVAAALPWFEVFCGLLLLAGLAVRGSALMLVLMLVPFTLLVLKRALAVHAAQAIPFCTIKFDCGCGTGEVYICRKLAENCLLIVLSGWLLAGWGRRFCLRYDIMHRQPLSEFGGRRS
jgi:uncharacterized membrane protein YphA (DoxX/SURF4 family)